MNAAASPLVIASQLEGELNAAIERLPSHPRIIPVPADAPWQAANDADVLIVRPGPEWRAARSLPRPEGLWPGRLRWVFSSSAGIDFYPPWLLDAPLVTCGRGTASDEIADYVIAAIYFHAKNLDAARVHAASEWRFRPLGRVAGSTVGIIGLGAIGREVAIRATALGTRVVAVRRSGSDAPAGVTLLSGVDDVVREADHIVIAVPATARTHHLFDAALFAKAKPNAHLINIARGSVVDQDALVAALDAGQIDFATLDVTDPEPLPDGHRLYSHPRVRLTPHVSSNYLAVRHRLFEKVAADLDRFARGETPSDVVDPTRGY